MKHIHGGNIYRNSGALDFSANLNPLGMPEAVREAARRGVEASEHYPDPDCTELRAAIGKAEGVDARQVICGNGAAELIFLLAQAKRPKKALLTAPAFAEYEQALRTVDCEMVWHELREDSGFALGESILEKITPETELVMLCNPNNPTGLLTEPALMERILGRCRETGSFLAVDECFQDFVEERERYTMKGMLKNSGNLFLLKAFTKRYAMAGIRLGYGLCSNPEVIGKMQESVQPWSVSIPAQAAGMAALKEEAYVNRAREIVRTERAFLKEELRKLGFQVYDSRANYIFFRGPAGLVEYALKKHVLIRDCSNYRGLTEGYYRVAVKTHEENRKLLEALA